MIKFSIGGKTVDPRNMKDAMMAAVLESIRAQIAEKVGAIRDPETGEFPTVVVRGDSIDNLTIQVEGSPQLVALAKERLGIEETPNEEAKVPEPEKPIVFFSYTSDDAMRAKRIAEALNAAGIDVWWDKWCIYPGDSLRQKIDEGISGCTHFLVLLTPLSINKPWVNQEMDAGLVRKLSDRCRFLPVRAGLAATSLPPLLSGMYSPEVVSDADIVQLINDIHGVSRKPVQGQAPAVVTESKDVRTGYSPAATMVAKLLVERSQHGTFADPQTDVETVAKETGLSEDDTRDAVHELSAFIRPDAWDRIMPKDSLFAEFDQYWKPWKPADDALRLAADRLNGAVSINAHEVAAHYGWEARRLNPAISYLFERGLIRDYSAIGTAPFVMFRVVGTDKLRRFVKSRT